MVWTFSEGCGAHHQLERVHEAEDLFPSRAAQLERDHGAVQPLREEPADDGGFGMSRVAGE